MYDNPKEILNKHTGSYSTLFKIYQSDEKWYKDLFLLVSVSISAALSLIAAFLCDNIYEIIQRLLDLSVGIIPNLLGFNLGAYILIVGFGATEILAVITKPLKGQQNYSLYQKLNGIMGVSVLIQIGTLSLVFILKIWDKIQEGFSNKFILFYFSKAINSINYIVLFITLSLVIYCFLILINVIKQVFLFAQTIPVIIYTNQLKKTTENEHELEKKINKPETKS